MAGSRIAGQDSCKNGFDVIQACKYCIVKNLGMSVGGKAAADLDVHDPGSVQQ